MRRLRFSCVLSASAAMILATQPANADLVLFEDFEDSTVGYTLSTGADPGFSDGNYDYFGRIGGVGGLSVGSDVELTVASGDNLGSGFFGAQDMDGDNASLTSATISWTGLNIAGLTDLSFSAFFAEDDDGSAQDWDSSNDYLRVRYQIDGGGFVDLFAIDSDVSSGFNGEPRIDTDFNGVGDGAAITDTFARFTENIAGTGLLLDLQVSIELDSGDEDIAFDNVTITGAVAAVPEASSFLFGGLVALAGGAGYLRRRRNG